MCVCFILTVKCTFLPTIYKDSLFSTPLSALVISDDSYSNSCGVLSHCGFNLNFFSDVEYLFMYLFLYLFLGGGYLLYSFAPFLIGLFGVFLDVELYEFLMCFGS